MYNRMNARLLPLVLLALLAACAGRGAVASAVPRNPLGDPQLYPLLAALPLEGAALDSLGAYERAQPGDFLARVAAVAEDSAAGPAVRYNAVLLLGERAGFAHLPTLRAAQRSSDLRVRGAVVVAAHNLVLGGRTEARPLIVAALDDPAPEVQAKALEVLGPADLPLLRDFLRRYPAGPVADIARDLVQVAEERGYPLEPDSSGTLRRTASAGHKLEFAPVSRWPQWDAALGTVTITPVAGAPLRIDSVEVVRGVVPVSFSADGRYIAYERGRRILVHDLQDGTLRDLGPGVAPRVRPFSNDILFLREGVGGRNDLAQRTRLSYDVVRAAFASTGDEPNPMGSLGVLVQPDRHGNYSPARWMHIAERGLKFTLEGDGLETFPLPDAFADRARP